MLRCILLLLTVAAIASLLAGPALADDPFLEGANLALPQPFATQGRLSPLTLPNLMTLNEATLPGLSLKSTTLRSALVVLDVPPPSQVM